jgi:ABC-type bacteriocin/lantibiotic exporter with double-glycine peptidase domain
MIFTAIISIFHELLISTFANRYVFDIRVMFIEHLINLPTKFFDQNSTGDIVTRLNNDIEDIRNFILFDIMAFYQAILNFLGASIFIGLMQWKILISNLIILPLLYYVLKYFRGLLYTVSLEVKNSYSETNKELVEGFKNINELKATNFELYYLKKQSRKYIDLLKKSIKNSVTNQISNSTIQFVINLTYLITIGYGGYLILQGDMTTGMLLAFLTMRSNLVSPVSSWSNLYTRYYNIKASIDRLNSYYEYDIEPGLNLPVHNSKYNHFEPSLEFRDVTFKYDDKNDLFSNLNFRLNAGEWIGVKGPSGIGKTTLFKLILKLIKQDKGIIFSGTYRSDEINNREWRSEIGYVSQKIFAINDSIRGNILMGREGIEEQTIKKVLTACCLYDEIESLPGKLNTNLDENGAIFSGGMLKRLMLARIIIEPKKILLLDEFFSALDDNMSCKLMSNLKKYLYGDTIVILISHRNTDFRYCDRIIDFQTINSNVYCYIKDIINFEAAVK